MLRFPSPLIKPDVRISRIRLSDWFRHGHTMGGQCERYSHPPSSWHRGRACLESSWSHAVLRRLAPSHRPSPSSTSTPEVRALPSAGVTQPRQYYDPVRRPPGPPSRRCRRRDLRPTRASPYYPAHPPDMPCPLPRWTGAGASVGCFPAPPGPSPYLRRVGVHDFTFEACSGFTRVTACQIA